MRRLSFKLRLTLAFAAVAAVLLVAVGLGLYALFQVKLNSAINRGLESRADAVAAVLPRAKLVPASVFAAPGAGVTQVLDGHGRLLASDASDRSPLLSASEAAAAEHGTVTLDLRLPGSNEHSRILGRAASLGGRRVVIVVAGSLRDREAALDSLSALLKIGGPIALLLAAAAGYLVAGAALRPVEAMRREAAAITDSEPGRRLPISDGGDELGRLGETLNAMLGRLEDALGRERAFVADASHELRTPLALLRTELELALRHARTFDEAAQALRGALAKTERLSRLADDLLVLARVEEGALPVEREAIDGRNLLDRIAERFALRAHAEGRRIEVVAPAGLALVADPLRLEQALGNLIDNALSHGAGDVTVAAAQSSARVEVHVTDQGPGFPKDFTVRAFERFSRGPDARPGGAGLGLALVDAVARAHDGSSTARTLRDGGADVWISLPAGG
ncbi:MAG TPA: HAMP domain-containing sensor histidine kinase [Solirubrobacteraceae bacterium]|nr:HAMP domain-containing sensor histidine kinase [Solirubrobacteraceae bacterium]